MTITGENVENVTQMTASAIEAANTEDQTTGNLDVVISIITGTTVLLTNGTAITEEVSSCPLSLSHTFTKIMNDKIV